MGLARMDLQALWDFEDLVLTRARLEAALASAAGADAQAAVLSQLARLAGLEGRMAEAKDLLNQARATGPGAAVLARVELEQGRLLREAGKHPVAATAFHKATKQAQAARAWDVALDALHMQAMDAPPEVARALLEQAEAICARLPHLNHWLGPFYNNLGWGLFENGDPAGALEMFTKDKALRRSLKAEHPRRTAAINCAKMLRFLGRNAEALDQLQRLVVEIGPQGFGLGLVYEERAELAFGAGRLDEARQYAAEARRVFEARGLSADQQPSRFERLDRLATGA